MYDTVELLDHRAYGWQPFYAGNVHHTTRTKMKNEVRWLVRAAMVDEGRLYNVPVNIRIVATFADGRTMLDPDNIMAKLYIDALKGIYIRDDTSKYVASVTTACVKGEADKVTIEITATKTPRRSKKYVGTE